MMAADCSRGSRISHRGGHRPRRGGANSRGGYVSKNLYVKTKESGPVGGAPTAPPWIRHWIVLLRWQREQMFVSSDVCRHVILDSSKYLGWNLGKYEHTQPRLRFEDYCVFVSKPE